MSLESIKFNPIENKENESRESGYESLVNRIFEIRKHQAEIIQLNESSGNKNGKISDGSIIQIEDYNKEVEEIIENNPGVAALIAEKALEDELWVDANKRSEYEKTVENALKNNLVSYFRQKSIDVNIRDSEKWLSVDFKPENKIIVISLVEHSSILSIGDTFSKHIPEIRQEASKVISDLMGEQTRLSFSHNKSKVYDFKDPLMKPIIKRVLNTIEINIING